MILNPAFINDLRPRLHRYIAKRVRDGHHSEDILQDVLMKLHVHAGDLPHADPVRTTAWALRTAHNAIIDHARSKRRPSQSLDLVPEPAATPAPDGWTMSRLPPHLAGCLTTMVGQLPPAYRAAIELADLQQRPFREVAERLGISLSGAKSRVQRGRRQLRAMISECCEVKFGRRGSVVSVARTGRGHEYCPVEEDAQNSCVHSAEAASIE
jgi:RNA polymerase sigma-70 factor, ECF subfamily